MAAKTWFVTNTIVGSTHQEMSETSPGSDATSSPAYGWTIGTVASGNFSKADAGTTQAATTFATTPVEPDGSITTTSNAGDCWRTTNKLTGKFVTGNWTFQMAVIATSGNAQRGRAGFRLFTSPNADGSSATERTAGRLVGGTIGDPSTQQTSVHNTTSITEFSLNDEYLFVQIGWEITTAGGMSTNNILHRVGGTASLVTSTDFIVSQALSASSPGVATLTLLSTFFRTLAATAVGVATLDTTGLFSRTLAAISTGVATLSRLATYSRTLAATAVGVPTLTRIKTGVRVLSVAMVGVPSLLRSLTASRALAATAVGIATLAKTLSRSLSATAVGIASIVISKLKTVAMGATATGVATLGLAVTSGPPAFSFTPISPPTAVYTRIAHGSTAYQRIAHQDPDYERIS